MAELDGITLREPKLDEKRYAILCNRTDPYGQYDVRATRTTMHLIDEDATSDIATENAMILAEEPDVEIAWVVEIVVVDGYDGKARIAREEAKKKAAEVQAGMHRTMLPNPAEKDRS